MEIEEKAKKQQKNVVPITIAVFLFILVGLIVFVLSTLKFSIEGTSDAKDAKFVKLRRKYTVKNSEEIEYDGYMKFKAPSRGTYMLKVSNAREPGKSSKESGYIGHISYGRWNTEYEEFNREFFTYNDDESYSVGLMSQQYYDMYVTDGEEPYGYANVSIPIGMEQGEIICIEISSVDAGVCDLQIIKM